MFSYLTTIAIIIFRIFVATAPEANCSWYGGPLEDPSPGNFHLGETTSGLIFNKYEWTCASAVLPMGSLLWCYNEETGICCFLRVTDGGPYAVDIKGNAKFPLEPHPYRQLDLGTLPFFFLSGGDLDRGVMTIRYRVVGRNITGMPYPGPGQDNKREMIEGW